MKSLARECIGYEWPRYVASVAVFALTGAILYVVAGMLIGQWQMFGAFERELDADIVIYSQSNASVFATLSNVDADSFYTSSNVKKTLAYTPNYIHQRVLTRQGKRVTLSAISVQTDFDSVTFPSSLSSDAKRAISVPGNVLVSVRLLKQLGLDVGSTINIRQRQNNIVGSFKAPFDNRINVILSDNTLSVYRNLRRIKNPQVILIRVHDRTALAETIQELNVLLMGKNAKAVRLSEYTNELSIKRLFEMREILVVFCVGLLVGVMIILIASQVLKTSISSMRRQFGVLKALGVPTKRLLFFIMEVAMWVGILGAMAALAVGMACQALFNLLDLPMAITAELFVYVSALLIVMAAITGLLSLRFALSVKPVELLR